MTIAAGSAVGRYRILTSIGVGGMGEVFKAHDITLDRDIALKILPAELVSDADRVRRFVQEAKSASALNHPHIVTIYEVGEEPTDNDAAPLHYIAMEFIDGETLRDKIHKEKLELKKLLEYLAQTADGLAKAHSAGIVHRDLKPDNIMVSKDGYAKILDFGLAKLVETTNEAPTADSEEVETRMMEATKAGIVMGTIGYMSPEQVQGKPVDHRSDVFSFGCILYEAATGKRPFAGDSMIDSLHKIVYSSLPPVKDFNPNAPVELQRIIKKCLAKDPDERYQAARDITIDIRDLIKEYDFQPLVSSANEAVATAVHQAVSAIQPLSPDTGPHSSPSVYAAAATAAAPAYQAAHTPKRGFLLAIALAGLLILASVVLYRVMSYKRTVGDFQIGKLTKLTSTGKVRNAAISPDGKYVVHVIDSGGLTSLWVRQVATASIVQIAAPADLLYLGLTFSRDGDYVYYVVWDKKSPIRILYQLPVLGGAPRRLVEDVDSSISFSPDQKQFVFVRNSSAASESQLIIANADGGNERKLAARRSREPFMEPAWSPTGKVIVCSTQSLSGGVRIGLSEVRVDTGAEKEFSSQSWLLIEGISWLSDGSGFMMSAMERTLGQSQLQIWQVSYPKGDVRRVTSDLNNYNNVSLTADSNALVTVQSTILTNAWVAPDGDATRATQITSGSGKYSSLVWTTNGKIVYLTDSSGNADIWVMDADGSNQRQLTSNTGVNAMPCVSADGRYIVFISTRASSARGFSIWRMDADGGNPKQLTFGENDYFPALSPDGKWVVYTPVLSEGKPTLWKVPIDGGEPTRVTDVLSLVPIISPDSKLIACRCSDSQPNSTPKICLFAFEGGPPLKTFDLPSPYLVRWSPDGKALTYLDSPGGIGNIWSQPIDGSAKKQITDFKNDQMFDFSWSKDGKLACTRGVVTTDAVLLTSAAK